MNLKIISNGIYHHTNFIDEDTGNQLNLPVSKIIWEIKAGEISKTTLECPKISIEVNAGGLEMLCEQCKYKKEEQ